jgi:HKD family nuclease
MTDKAFLSYVSGKTTYDLLSDLLSKTDADSLFFASAYVTQAGVNRIETLLDQHQIGTCVAVFGLDGTVTQPKAIESAIDLGWTLRLVEGGRHHFHPKIALTGDSPPDPFAEAYGGYIGSANFTQGGLISNIEAGLIVQERGIVNSLTDVAERIWELAEPVNNVDLDKYSSRYANAARKRPTDYQPPGVGSSLTGEIDPEDESEPPQYSTYHPKHATVAWAGLESFTGEYSFQVEFPKTAGEVIRSLLGADEAEIGVLCSDDEVREMKYKFYEDNGMFRLNIPNEVTGVEQARRERSGIALVTESERKDASLQLEIINDEELVGEFVQRSKREGSWDETPTRLYGWS